MKLTERENWYLSSCLPLDIHSQGATKKEAENNLLEALSLFFISCFHRGTFQYNYDNYSDVLYISFGKPRKAITVETDDGYLMRYNPFTDKLVGVTIIDFKERFFRKKRLNIKNFIKQELPHIISAQN